MPESVLFGGQPQSRLKAFCLRPRFLRVSDELRIRQPDEKWVDVHRVCTDAVFGTSEGGRSCATKGIQHMVTRPQSTDKLLNQVPGIGWRQAQPIVTSQRPIRLEREVCSLPRRNAGRIQIGKKKCLAVSLH